MTLTRVGLTACALAAALAGLIFCLYAAASEEPMPILTHGFRHDPMQFLRSDHTLQGALVRTFVFSHPQPGDAGERSVWNRGGAVLSEEQIRDTIELAALKRASKPADVAQATLFLASEVTARQLTGQLVSVSGGRWMP